MFNELVVYTANASANANANPNTNANATQNTNANTNPNLIIFTVLLALLVATVIYEIIMLYTQIHLLKIHINKLEDKIQSNHTKLIDAHNDNTVGYLEYYKELEEKMQSEYDKWRDTVNEDTLVYLQGCSELEKKHKETQDKIDDMDHYISADIDDIYNRLYDNVDKIEDKIQTLYDDLFDNIHDSVCEKIYAKLKKAHNENVQILKEFTDDLEEKFILQTQIVKEMQERLDKMEEIQLLEEKKYKLQLQKVSQENLKLVQHSSVLFDKTKTMQTQINSISKDMDRIDDGYVAIGILKQTNQPYYIHKSKTELYDDQWMHTHVQYINMTKLTKTQIKKFNINMLFNMNIKITENDSEIKLHMDHMHIPQQKDTLRNAYKLLQEHSISILFPNDDFKNRILNIVNEA